MRRIRKDLAYMTLNPFFPICMYWYVMFILQILNICLIFTAESKNCFYFSLAEILFKHSHNFLWTWPLKASLVFYVEKFVKATQTHKTHRHADFKWLKASHEFGRLHTSVMKQITLFKCYRISEHAVDILLLAKIIYPPGCFGQSCLADIMFLLRL